MQFLPDLSTLPPWALVIFAVSLAVIFATVWFGRFQGGRSPSASGTRAVEVAGAIVDNSAINRLADAVEDLTKEIRSLKTASSRMADQIDGSLQRHGDQVGKLMVEVIRRDRG